MYNYTNANVTLGF